MTKTFINEEREKLKIITPMKSAVTEVVKVTVPIAYWYCDYCGERSPYDMLQCACCKKHACTHCKESNLKILEFEVGSPCEGLCSECQLTPEECEDKEVDSAYVALCSVCKSNPTGPTKSLLNMIRDHDAIQKLLKDSTKYVIKEIRKLDME